MKPPPPLALPHLLQLHSLLLKSPRSAAARLIAATPTHAWNTLIRGLTLSFRPFDAMRLFPDLLRLSGTPDNFTYPFVIKACADAFAIGTGGMVHGLVVKAGFLADLYVGNTLLHMYARGGMIGYARKVFDEMPVRDVVSWSTMIEAFVACDHPREALIVFLQMRLANVEPNSVTLVSLLSACSHMANLTMGRSIHAYIMVNKIELGVALGTAVVDMYARCGRVEESFQVFNSMKEKDLQSWTIMISGFSDHGLGKEAISLFSRMEMSGLHPDSMAFSVILCACSHLGLVDEGQKLFKKMVEFYNIKPTLEHYGCMVDLYGRAGAVKAAYEFIKQMPITPNSAILRSFLGACREHGEIPDIDGQLMKLLLKEEPDLGSNYVLAANVSALSGRWDDVAQLRSNIGERGLKKIPGCSWVEVNAASV